MRSALSHLECAACASSTPADRLQQTCPGCGGILLARYDLGSAGWPTTLRNRPRSLWRYFELLPVQDPGRIVSLGEVVTPLVAAPALTGELKVARVAFKDEGLLPTGSFKARGAAVGVSRLAELGGDVFTMPTNGNAGSAWSAYAARAGLRAHVFVPRAAPAVTADECRAAGAEVTIVDGLIGDAGKLARELAEARGWFDAATFKEPYRLEGKKTLGFEIAEQLRWRLPDAVVYPTGGGVGLLGMWKAWAELRELGLVKRLPRLVAAQAAGCAPVVTAFQAGDTETQAWPQGETHAFGINVGNPFAGRLILAALRESGGCAVAVGEDAIRTERAHVYRAEGIHLGPEGACAMAAARALAKSGWFDKHDHVLVLNTGSGLKY